MMNVLSYIVPAETGKYPSEEHNSRYVKPPGESLHVTATTEATNFTFIVYPYRNHEY